MWLTCCWVMRFGHARITTCIIPVARVPTTTTSNLGQSNKLLRFASVVWKNTFVCGGGGGGVIVLVQAKYNIFFHHTSRCSLLVWFHCIAHLFPCRQLTQTHATHTPMLFERVADSNALCTNAHIQHTCRVYEGACLCHWAATCCNSVLYVCMRWLSAQTMECNRLHRHSRTLHGYIDKYRNSIILLYFGLCDDDDDDVDGVGRWRFAGGTVFLRITATCVTYIYTMLGILLMVYC